jgi:prepilin-type N-terminal cleavage/methylation domain-containing protein
MSETTLSIRRSKRSGRRAFTLVEVLAALLLIAIVLPVVMRGISAGTSSASLTRRRTEASSLAQSKLAEIMATEQWRDGALNGTFTLAETENAADYSWRAELQQWSEENVKQLDLYVTWTTGKGEQNVMLSTLIYDYVPPEETEEETGTGPETGGAT